MDDSVAVAHKIGADGAGTQRLQPSRRVLGQERACAQRISLVGINRFLHSGIRHIPFRKCRKRNDQADDRQRAQPDEREGRIHDDFAGHARDGLGGKRHQIVEHEGGNVEIGEGQIAVQRAVAEKGRQQNRREEGKQARRNGERRVAEHRRQP